MINFGRLYIEGFGSFVKPLTFNLDKGGINVIKGENGAGKTTLLAAVVWVLYGKMIKENSSVASWPWVRGRDYVGTKVELEFVKGSQRFTVIRCLDYKKEVRGIKGGNRLLFMVNDQEFENKYKRDIQEDINSTIGISYDLFVSSILFGQKMKRLIENSGTAQKKLLDEAFETIFIQEGKEKAKARLVELFSEISEQKSKLSILETKLSGKEEELENNLGIIAKFDEKKAQKINDYRNLIAEEKAKLKKLNSTKFKNAISQLRADKNLLTEEYDKLGNIDRVELENLSKQVFIQSSKLDYLTKEIEKLKSHINGLKTSSVCPMCGSVVSKEKSKEMVLATKLDLESKNKSKNELQEAYLGNKNKLASMLSLKESIDSYIDKIEELDIKIKSLENNEIQIKNLNENIKGLRLQIRDIMEEKLDIDIEKLKITIQSIQNEILPINKLIGKLDRQIRNYNWIIDVPLSNSGLRVFIFNSMIEAVNERLEYYSKFIGFRSKFSFNMESANKGLQNFIYRGDHKISYHDLSGGQSQLINVAIAFSIHDVISRDHRFNVLFLDEVFESLSKNNIEIVSELIMEKSRKKSLWLITHRDEFSTVNSREYNLELSGDITTIKK